MREGEGAGWRHGDCVFLLVVIIGLLVARIPVMGVRFFDPDELEHSHAAWSVWKGLVPYKDFFEHHTPWYYFALSPFFRWFAVDQSFDSARRFLLFGRGLSLVLTALSVVLVFLVGRLGSSRRTGLLAGLLLVGQPVVIQKTLEIRPDVLALPFFLGGLWLLLRGLLEAEGSPRRNLRWFLGGGLCLGAAIMCTQKMLFVLPGAFAGLGLWLWAGRQRLWSSRALAVLMVLAGVAIPVALTWAAFAVKGGGTQFLQNNFLLNARWRLRSERNVVLMLQTSWPMLVLSVIGASVALVRFSRAPRRHHGDVLVVCSLGGLVAGALLVPAAYRQYYLMPLALACVLAAKGLGFLVDLAPQRARAWVLVGATVPLLAWPVHELRTSFKQRDDRQTARLRYVFEHTAPGDSVLDGWLGTQLFRPHPLYYFFLHRELLVMLSEKEKNAVLDDLESGRVRPSLITLDPDLAALGSRFLAFVRRNYVTTDGLFYRPGRARPGTAGGTASETASETARTSARFPACPAAGRAATPRDQGGFRAAIARKWASCSHTVVGGEDGDALGSQGDGIEIKPDGRYQHLARNATGKLVGIPGPAEAGTIIYGVTDFGAIQTTFRSNLRQLLVAAPVITANPTLLIIRTANADHRYVADDGL